ncbi:hypothetical protein IEQ34_010854 [Dendrobium chrysotoxum]|uniref:VWFA domain-containing protein n=1 Tax=Dendrobium chrysotoxum TaxID=161865 RepID=A0AAV7GVY6_DENCH|nr:hypothetical protein IEQ34_010854 [Dendrobium chrysotoxum]
MEEEFTKSVENGLRLAKRVYSGKERYTVAPPRPPVGMESSRASLIPSAPMVYAVIGDPAIVDNPDFPSYQPHVYGRCDPPALIPLQMKEIAMEVDSYLDTAFVSVQGRWRVHCVMSSRKCDCRLVLPLGEQGSILGVEVNFAKRSYSTQLIERGSSQSMEKLPYNEHAGYLNWSQKLLYKDGHFSISIPFNFPEFVTPFAKIVAKREKIQLNVNICNENEVMIKKASHALKEKCRQVGKLSFLYEADVENWSTKDFDFAYNIISRDFYGGILLKTPSFHDYDQTNMFCLYLYPGNHQKRKVFRKEVVFLVDISGSMEGKVLENVRNALFLALSELVPADYFNIIAFNERTFTLSSYMEPANDDKLEDARHWISKNFLAHGGTNMMQPLNEALALLSNTREGSVPYVFLVTDGAVENERAICRAVKTCIENRGPITPRICTFGIGTYCNHYFLQMLSSIGRGHYGATYDEGSVESTMQRWFRRALFPLIANITVHTFDDLDAFEVSPSNIPDLLVGCPLIISGKYQGKFPDTVKIEGRLADMSDIAVNLKVQNMGNIPFERVFSKQQIDLLTAQAWFSESKQLADKVAKLSLHSGIPSEYTHMVFLEKGGKMPEGLKQKHEKSWTDSAGDHIPMPILLHNLTPGFGNPLATAENLPPGYRKPKQTQPFEEVIEKAVGCCSGIFDCRCCVCCIKTCSKMNDQCACVLYNGLLKVNACCVFYNLFMELLILY